jgi:hypothetical protein
MKIMTQPLLLSVSLLATALLAAGCSTPAPSVEKDELVFQVCLRDKPMAAVKRLDFTMIHPDRRDTESAMAIGTTTRQQPIFEAAAGKTANVKTTVLSMDRITWYGFEPPVDVRADIWSEWRPADYVTRTDDAPYRLQHDLSVEKRSDGTGAVNIRYRIMRYRDVLAERASRLLEIPHTDFAPC